MANANAYTSGVPPFLPGSTVSASALERLREADQRALPQRSVDTFVSQRPGGTVITPIPRRTKGVPVNYPFRVYDVTDDKGPKVVIHYGAVIDLTDWQAPGIRVPTINGTELTASLSKETPKLDVSEENSLLYLVIEQGEYGEIATTPDAVRIQTFSKMPTSVDGTAYLPVAQLDFQKNNLIIRQILASQIIWPLKPDFINWRQKKQTTPSALWIGGGSPHTKNSDILSDLFIEIRRPDFDNGRDGNLPFSLRMEKAKNFEFTFDRNNERGFECCMNDTETKLNLDGKSTVSSSIGFQTSNAEASLNLLGPSEGSTITATTGLNKCDTIWQGPAATVRINATQQGPSLKIQGQGNTTIGTIAGKDVIMREVTVMVSPTSSQKAYFLCSPLEDVGEPKPENIKPPQSHSQHHIAQHAVSLHHAGHQVIPPKPQHHVTQHAVGLHHAGHQVIPPKPPQHHITQHAASIHHTKHQLIPPKHVPHAVGLHHAGHHTKPQKHVGYIHSTHHIANHEKSQSFLGNRHVKSQIYHVFWHTPNIPPSPEAHKLLQRRRTHLSYHSDLGEELEYTIPHRMEQNLPRLNHCLCHENDQDNQRINYRAKVFKERDIILAHRIERGLPRINHCLCHENDALRIK